MDKYSHLHSSFIFLAFFGNENFSKPVHTDFSWKIKIILKVGYGSYPGITYAISLWAKIEKPFTILEAVWNIYSLFCSQEKNFTSFKGGHNS